jgi:hypothetical protein
MIFVELTPFVAFRKEYWIGEDLRAMQNVLLMTRDAGDLIRGGARLRKLPGQHRKLMKDIDHG